VIFEQICVGKTTLAIIQKGEYSENPNLKNEKKHKECKASENKMTQSVSCFEHGYQCNDSTD